MYTSIHYISRKLESNNIIQTYFKYIHAYTHYTARMSKSKNNHSRVEYCTAALSFFFKDLLHVTQNGSITVVLLPL